MPQGKPAGVPCIHLDAALRCGLWGRPERPDFCAGLSPSADMYGTGRGQALVWLAALEVATAP